LRKMRTFISCFIENIDLLPDDEEVDIGKFVGQKIACTLATNSEGYLRIQAIFPASKLAEVEAENPFENENEKAFEQLKKEDGDAFDPFAD
jgi:hypothetical protein